MLAIDLDKIEKMKSGTAKTVGKKELRLKRGISMDTGVRHNVMPTRIAGKRKIRPSSGSKRSMCYVAAGNDRIKNEGEIAFDFESLECHRESFVFQIAAVSKGRGSGYMVDHGFRVF